MYASVYVMFYINLSISSFGNSLFVYNLLSSRSLSVTSMFYKNIELDYV
jgi:hypothetical protein